MAPKNGTVQEKKFFSKELNEEMTLLVYLPSNYSLFINTMSLSRRTATIISGWGESADRSRNCCPNGK